MARGQVVVVTLAALAAVFLQGCGKKIPAAPLTISTTVTAPAKKGATTLQVANTAGYLANSKVTISGPTFDGRRLAAATTLSEVNAIKAPSAGALVLWAPLQNNYGVGTTITMNVADAGKTASAAGVTTSAATVESISPNYIRPSVATTIAMTGPVVAGDLLSFSTDANCGNASLAPVPSLAVTVITANTSSVSFTPPAVGNYYMCYRSVGKTDSVKQTFGQLFVQLKETTNIITAKQVSAKMGGDEVAFPGSVAKGDSYAFVAAGIACPLTSSFMAWTKITAAATELTGVAPSVAGKYDLCYNAATKIPFKQTGVELTVTATKTARLYESAIVDVDEVDGAKRADDDSARNMILGAGGLVLVAFAVVGVKNANSRAARTVAQSQPDENLEEAMDGLE